MHRVGAAFLFFVLVISTVLGGGPAGAIVTGWLLGTRTVTFPDGSGGAAPAILGPGAPRPAWIPVLPGAEIAGGVQTTGNLDGFGSIDLVTRMPLEEIERFYVQRLSDLGYRVRNEGTGQLAPAVARYLGVAGQLIADHPGEGQEGYRRIVVQLRTEEGWLVKTRLVSLHWRKNMPEIQLDGTPR